MKKKELLFLFMSSVIAIVLSVVFGELYAFIKNKHNWVLPGAKHDSEFGWVLTPNNVFERNGRIRSTNSMGFRSPEIDSERKHVIVVGDSVAFGLGLNDDETLSYYLGKNLEGFQVLNFSVPGYSVDQYYMVLKKYIAKTNPALVVVVIFSGNDFEETRKDNLYGIGKPWIKFEGDRMKIISDTIPRFSCTNLLSRSWTLGVLSLNHLVKKICGGNEYDGMDSKFQMVSILKEMNQLVSSRNSSLLFVLSPTIYDYYEEAKRFCPNFENSEDCLVLRKTMKDLLKAQTKRTSDSNSKNLFRIAEAMDAFTLSLNTLQNIFRETNLPWIDLLSFNVKRRLDITKHYNESDPFHFSPMGNRHIVEIILHAMKIDGEKFLFERNY